VVSTSRESTQKTRLERVFCCLRFMDLIKGDGASPSCILSAALTHQGDRPFT
jgi:hypothetical protein